MFLKQGIAVAAAAADADKVADNHNTDGFDKHNSIHPLGKWAMSNTMAMAHLGGHFISPVKVPINYTQGKYRDILARSLACTRSFKSV